MKHSSAALEAEGERGEARGQSTGASWLRSYKRADLGPDLIAGAVVATMLVPQAMAYALLAELPVEVGLYAALLPVAIYALLGSSRFLAVGPVAMVSLLVASGVRPLAGGDPAQAVALAMTLALMVGVVQLAMGLLRAGFLVNFLSHPVLSGFTSAAALVIGISQLKHLLGINISQGEYPFETALALWDQRAAVSAAPLCMGLLGIGGLLTIPRLAPALLRNRSAGIIGLWSRSGPLWVVAVGTLVAWLLQGQIALPTVGATPPGLPPLRVPRVQLEHVGDLLPTAVVISLVGFMESFAVAKALGSKRRQRVIANRELVALGAANIGSAFSGGYPVTGGFSRSVVNFQAGARTGLASLTTAALMATTLLFLTPLLTHLPKAILSAIILVAVSSLVDFRELIRLGRYSAADGACWAVTFVAVLGVGIEKGVALGALTSIALFLWRTSRPHVAIIGQVGDTAEYRNILRHDVTVQDDVLAVRVDENLYFANARRLEEWLLRAITDRPRVRQVLLVCSGINFVDGTGLEALEECHRCLADAGVTLSFSAVKGPVLDQLARVHFWRRIGEQNLFTNTHIAMQELARRVSSSPGEETEA